jgi:hypothetical protein
MKKAMWLAGLFLCTSALYAAETLQNAASEGKKRNEEMYEQYLEQTGWKNQETRRQDDADSKQSHEGHARGSSQPKSS